MIFRKLQQFMYGRYGGDGFNLFLLVSGLVFSILGRLFAWILFLPADALYIYAMFRVFSKNIPARQRENQAFLGVWSSVTGFFQGERQKLAARKTHKYFKCPNCKQQLRAPRGRGMIEVTCQRCHHVFRTKT